MFQYLKRKIFRNWVSGDMITDTLTSLAMLKVNMDYGNDYLDYLKPFISQVLYEDRPDPVTDAAICERLRNKFGLEIPGKTVQIILQRLSRSLPLTKNNGVYRITGELSNPKIDVKKAEAARHISSVLFGLIEFSKKTIKPLSTETEAIEAICSYLSNFNIPCLRAYLRGTVIPEVEIDGNMNVNLVSQYVINIQKKSPERFESFMILVQGQMLANSLLCPDLQNAPKTYKGVTFLFDTPIVLHALGLDGYHKQMATVSLIDLLKKLGSNVSVFSHSRDELQRVIIAASDSIDDFSRCSSIAIEAKRSGKSKSDLLLISSDVDEQLSKVGITIIETPRYVVANQIDEKEFSQILEQKVQYSNPRAKECDINSIRCIYVLRNGHTSQYFEKSKAIFVTNNVGIVEAATIYSNKYFNSFVVSAAITDFSLVNMAWLKAPMGASNIPVAEVMAFSYAALQPTKDFLCKYLSEIEKLEESGVSEREHQLLRSTLVIQDELLTLTLGNEEAFTQKNISETLDRVVSEIKSEETEKLGQEQDEHQLTRNKLADTESNIEKIKMNTYWGCSKRAERDSWIIIIIISVALLVGMFFGINISTNNEIIKWLLYICGFLFILVSYINMLTGMPLIKLRERISEKLLNNRLKKKEQDLGIKLDIKL